MSLAITNSLTGKKEPFEPIHPPQARGFPRLRREASAPRRVRMYVCGPTVYDDPHIGHIRGAFIFDVIRKYLQYRGYSVKFIRNITDVDDKIIEKARQESVTSHPSTELRAGQSPVTSERPENLKQTCEQIASKYTDAYHQALEKLGIDPPDEEPRATQQIPKMIQMIGQLIQKGIAYTAEGNVYFSVGRFPSYGKLSHQNPGQLLKSHRVEDGHGKKDALDFALWKSAKDEEPSWPSPWGPGRPGWHIECSVMSQREFGSPLGETEGETLDIHGGGVDLVFPHHENEIAQSEAAWDKPFARYWIHNGLLTVEGEKMSKSVGNVIALEDIFEKGYQANTLKLFFLQSHYRSPVDFSWAKMEEARKGYEDFGRFFDKCEKLNPKKLESPKVAELKRELRVQFESAMDDDFNTPKALAVLFEGLKQGNIALLDEKESEALTILEAIKEQAKVFGLFGERRRPAELPQEAASLIAKRDEFREKKDFKSADEIRKKIHQMGILLEDAKTGTTWRWKT